MLMGNADTLMLSQYSDNSVAAVGVSNQLFSFVIVMLGFIVTGTSILISQQLGAKHYKEARHVVVVSLATNLLFGLVLSVGLFFLSPLLLQLMNIPNELMKEAVIYLRVVGAFSFVQAMIMTISAVLRSYGFSKDAMYITIGMNIINVVGNYLFIFGPFGFPVLGVTGVAIATVTSRTIGLIIFVLLLYKRMDNQLPLSYLFTVPKKELSALVKIGVPSAAEQLSYNISQIVITYFIASMGTQALTTKVYTQNIMMFILLFSFAIGQGTQILIGHQVGAKKYEDAYKQCIRSLNIALVLTVIIGFIFYMMSGPFFGIFTDNQEIIALGTSLILLSLLLEPGRAFNLIVLNGLRAAGDVKFPVYIGVVSMWGVSVALSYLLGIKFGLGLIGIWIAFTADEWLRGLLMLWRWRGRKWQRMSFVSEKEEQREVAATK